MFVTNFKPPKGTALIERRKQKAERVAFEQAEKDKVRKRDGAHYCRLVPGCTEKEKHETAHLHDKGMGGDQGLRSTADQMLRACFFHHQGETSLHSGALRVVCLTPEGTNGPIEVWCKVGGAEYLLGRESAVCQWERD